MHVSEDRCQLILKKTQECQHLPELYDQAPESALLAFETNSRPLLITIEFGIYCLANDTVQIANLLSRVNSFTDLPPRLFPTLITMARSLSSKLDLSVLPSIYRTAFDVSCRSLQNISDSPKSSSLLTGDYLIELLQITNDPLVEEPYFDRILDVLARSSDATYCVADVLRSEHVQWLVVKAHNIAIGMLRKAALLSNPRNLIVSAERWLALSLALLKYFPHSSSYESTIIEHHSKALSLLN